MATSFKVLYDGIGLYADEALEQETFSVMLEKDAVHPGSYISDKVVCLQVDGSDPVYCSKINLEEIVGHSVADTVVIHADPSEFESPSPNNSGPPVPPPAPSNTRPPPPVPSTVTAAGPPPVPPPQENERMASDRWTIEERKSQFTNNRYDSMSEVKLSEDMLPAQAYTEHGTSVLSTGNSLEDLDNLLRIYRNLGQNDGERALVYKEFWDKFYTVQEKEPYLILQIPTRVRGFLTVMSEQDMEPYKRDRIMTGVLSRNGLMEEPTYIRKRYLFSYFVQYEIFDWMKWFIRNCGSAQAWMFLSLWILILGQVIHVGIDFGRGDPWRAVLMQCLVPLTFIASMQFVNTPFTATIMRTLIENRCAALCTVYGRVSLNALIIFFCMGSVELEDVLLLFGVFMCLIWTTVIFVEYTRLEHSANYVRIATGSVDKLKEKFLTANEDKDGVLKPEELRNFFKSYNNILRMWQVELMISEFDIHRDGGLRFDALKSWFDKIPINHLTRINLLKAKPTDLSHLIYRPGGMQMEKQPSLDGAHQTKGDTTGGPVIQHNTKHVQYSSAEREWLGLAGIKQ